MFRFNSLALAPLALLAAAVACNFEPPPPTLRFQMFQVDGASKEIAVSLSKPELYAKLAENARLIADVAADPAFDRYELKPSYRLAPEELETFRSFRKTFGERARSLEAAALAGDTVAVALGYAKLEFLCQDCHAKFRPGL